jgi:hypothetical protein
MQLDAVIAGILRPRRRVAELGDDAVDLGYREAVDGLPPAGACHFEEMDDLRHDLRGRCLVHAARELAMPGDEAGIG